jgi:hypothetical protein
MISERDYKGAGIAVAELTLIKLYSRVLRLIKLDRCKRQIAFIPLF